MNNNFEKIINFLLVASIITPLFFEIGFRVCFFSLTIIGIAHWIYNRKIIQISKFEKFLFMVSLMFVFSGLLSYFVNDHYHLARATAMEVYPLFIGIVPLIILFKKTKPKQSDVILGFSLLTLISSIAAIVQIISNGPSRLLLNHNNNEFVTPLLIGTFICTYAFFKSSKLRILTGISSISGIISILLIQNRMAWIILVVLGLFTLKKLIQSNTKKLIAIVIVILLCGGIYQLPSVNKRIKGTLLNIENLYKNKNTSIGHRVEMTRIGLHYFKKHPYLGIGPRRLEDQNFTAKLRSKKTILRQAFYHGHFHNQYIEALATRGVFGFICLLLLLLAPLSKLYRNSKNVEFHAFCGAITILTFSIVSLSNSPFEFKFLIMFFTICTSLSIAKISLNQHEH